MWWFDWMHSSSSFIGIPLLRRYSQCSNQNVHTYLIHGLSSCLWRRVLQVFATEFLIDGNTLSLLVSDSNTNLYVFAYDRNNWCAPPFDSSPRCNKWMIVRHAFSHCIGVWVEIFNLPDCPICKVLSLCILDCCTWWTCSLQECFDIHIMLTSFNFESPANCWALKAGIHTNT